ncbi:MAG: dethiobiotin synthase [Opitutales bacterium]
METILVSGNDTGIGKTWVTRALVAFFAERGCRSIQIVKPVETGVDPGSPHDAPWAAAVEGLAAAISHHTLVTFREPLAPLEAARRDDRSLDMAALANELRALPPVDVRLIEGAGGLAVPVAADGRDWADFGALCGVDWGALVVEDRLGAINQARLLVAYAQAKGLRHRLILNQRTSPPEGVASSNRTTLQALDLPLWAEVPPGGALAPFPSL